MKKKKGLPPPECPHGFLTTGEKLSFTPFEQGVSGKRVKKLIKKALDKYIKSL